jgi:hypothetical protein
VWTREIDDQRATAVFLPSDPAYADFALRMGALLAALALVEDRSQLAILADLITGTKPMPSDAERIESLRAALGEIAANGDRWARQAATSALNTDEEVERDC